LIYFGARRSWREMLAPLAVFMLSAYCLTTYTWHYAFHWQSYGITWTWYVAAMVLGSILLRKETTFVRGAAATLIGPTGFFLVSNFGVWVASGGMYPPTFTGLEACYIAGLPFYRNDLAATAIVLGVALGVPALLRRMNPAQAQEALAGK
jgi:hypothetical protein